MKKYTYKQEGKNDYSITETSTGQVIINLESYESAKSLAGRLNGGQGFAGLRRGARRRERADAA